MTPSGDAVVRPEPPGLLTDRILAISPHFDDAVLSAGHAIASGRERIVLTVFAGSPAIPRSTPGRWDAQCGFTSADDVVAIRRAENACALRALGAQDRSLDLVDRQYRNGARADVEEIAEQLATVIDDLGPTTVLLPSGTGHRDHDLVCRAGLAARATERRTHPTGGTGGRLWACYVELPYAWRERGWAARRLARLQRMRLRLTPVLGIPLCPPVKAAAVAAYGSQVRGMGLDDVTGFAAAAEQIWRIDDRPPPMQRLRGRTTTEWQRYRRSWDTRREAHRDARRDQRGRSQ
jgi:LmbE family N-acetylglucosaminyl deacetylase